MEKTNWTMDREIRVSDTAKIIEGHADAFGVRLTTCGSHSSHRQLTTMDANLRAKLAFWKSIYYWTMRGLRKRFYP